MNAKLRRELRERARGLCEYCRLPMAQVEDQFSSDHIVAEQHEGETSLDNLAFACSRCNRNKGPNLTGIDPVTGNLTRLFHPRRDVWHEHFEWNGPIAVGRTDVGRTTIYVLKMNHPQRVELRAVLVDRGVFLLSPDKSQLRVLLRAPLRLVDRIFRGGLLELVEEGLAEVDL